MNGTDRRRPSRAALIIAAVVVLVALVALVVLPLLVTARINRLATAISERAEPARKDLNEVNYQLSRQIADLSRHVLTGDETHIEQYRMAVAAQESSMQQLARRVPRLGGGPIARFADLEAQVRRWHGVVDGYLAAHNTSVSGASSQIAYEANYPEVIEAVYRLDGAISDYQTEKRAEAAQWTQRQNAISFVLVVLAFAAAITVVWMVVRLRTLAAHLAFESDERRVALGAERQSRETVESLLRSRDEILGIVSHDLRSPLTTITLSTQLMQGSSPAEQTEHIETILATTRRMQRLIQDLLDMTKMENSTLSVRQEPVDTNRVVADVVASHAPIASEKRIDLQTSADSSLPQISGDHDRLVQALGNLLGNALKFTPEGGTVRFSAKAGDGRVHFSVEDSGPGISPGDLPHLFEPFWQSKKTAHLGAGLGLKIARAIVEAHGGSMQVSNAPTGGACFAFDIPAA